MEIDIKQEKIQNFVDAISFREPKKVPVCMEFINWPFAYAGKTYKEVMDDPYLTAKTYTKFLDDIKLDMIIMGYGISTPVKSYEALESNAFVLSEDDTCIQHYQSAASYMSDDEYPEMINNYDYFRNVTMVRKVFPIFTKPRNEAYEALKKAAIEYKKFNLANMLIGQDIQKRNIPKSTGDGMGYGLMYYAPFNVIFDTLRGIKNALTDLRRRPDTVKEAIKVITDHMPPSPNDPEVCKDKPYPLLSTIYHSECFLSPTQYDELYFNEFKRIFKPFFDVGAKCFLKGEGHFLNTIDRFRQLPKGSMVIMLDEDDPFEMHKAIGDWATIGAGITSELLKFGTKQQCIDYVKKSFDTFAPGGGFIFLPPKPFIAAKDANLDNLRAVYEFANEYGKK